MEKQQEAPNYYCLEPPTTFDISLVRFNGVHLVTYVFFSFYPRLLTFFFKMSSGLRTGAGNEDIFRDQLANVFLFYHIYYNIYIPCLCYVHDKLFKIKAHWHQMADILAGQWHFMSNNLTRPKVITFTNRYTYLGNCRGGYCLQCH